MGRSYLWFVWCVLFLHLVQTSRGHAAEPIDAEPDGFAIAERIFEEFVAETESERELLDSIEITPAEEARIGESQLASFLASLKQRNIRVLRRGKDVEYLRSLVNEIHPLMSNADRYEQIHVYVTKTDTTDARAFPGGFIVCCTGLMDFAGSEAALLGVIAHELSHIDRGHQLRQTRSMKFAHDFFVSGVYTTEDLASGGSLLMKQLANPFHPEEETQADLDAAKWVYERRYDPLQFALLFRRLHERDAATQGRLPRFLRTHPYHVERYETIRELSTRLKAVEWGEELYVGRQNIQKRIARSARRFP